MKKKPQQPQRTVEAQIELDNEVIADLEPAVGDLDIVRGGVRPSQNCRATTNAG